MFALCRRRRRRLPRDRAVAVQAIGGGGSSYPV